MRLDVSLCDFLEGDGFRRALLQSLTVGFSSFYWINAREALKAALRGLLTRALERDVSEGSKSHLAFTP